MEGSEQRQPGPDPVASHSYVAESDTLQPGHQPSAVGPTRRAPARQDKGGCQPPQTCTRISATHFYFFLTPSFLGGMGSPSGEVVVTRTQGTRGGWISWVFYGKALSFQPLRTICFPRMWWQLANFA